MKLDTSAPLHLQYKVDKWDDYTLNYATGTFVRQEYDQNLLQHTRVGSFSIAGSNPGGPGVTPVNGGTAPVAIAGVNWVVKQPDGVVEASVMFANGASGTENDPFDGSTVGRFDQILFLFARLSGVTIRLGPGVFQTRGGQGNSSTTFAWDIRSNVKIVGAGMYQSALLLIKMEQHVDQSGTALNSLANARIH